MYLFKRTSLKIFFSQILLLHFSAHAQEANNKTNNRFPIPPHIKFSVNSTVSKSSVNITEPSDSSKSGQNSSGEHNTSARFPIPPSLSDRKDEVGEKRLEDISLISRNAKSIRTNSDKNSSPSFHPAGNNGGIFGHTSSYGTAAPSIVLFKPAPSYMRPSAKPMEMGSYPNHRPLIPTVPTPIEGNATPRPAFTTGPPPATFRPIFTTTFRPNPITTFRPIPTTTFRPIPTTTFRPIPTTTFRPIPTTTFRPIPSTTFRPIFTTTSSPLPASSTIAPIIGVDEEDYDEEEEDTPINPEGGVGRSLLTKRKGTSRKKSSNSISRQSVAKLASNTRSAARAMQFEGGNQNVVTDFVFSDIKCYRTKSREFFGATIHMKKGYHVPYIRDRPQDPLTSSDCKMEQLESPDVRYRVAATDLRACGVEQCGDSLCLTMVFPRVPTLALADDEVTTIKCLPQQSSVSETQSISFSGDNLENRRSSSTVEGGGQDFAAEVGIFRQNPGTTNGLFAKRVSSGGVVQLGEPLQLRSVVRGGDGWSHSSLSDVKVWRMREGYNQNMERLSTNDASEVITLVDGYGCRNPEYDVIAESHPVRDLRNDLVHHFNFRAFLFRGQRANEPLIVTAKVQACQEAGECKPSDCMSRSSDSTAKRYKRAIEHHNASSIIHGYDSQLALHVVGLRDDPASITPKTTPPVPVSTPATRPSADDDEFACEEKMTLAATGGACVMLFLCGIAACLLFYTIGSKRAAALRNSEISEIKPEATLPNQTIDNVIKRNKPLPPTPVDYSNTGTSSVDPLRVGDRLNNSRRSYQRSNNSRAGNHYSCEYECISETRGKVQSNKAQDDGVVIVYCCKKDKKKHGSTSAPSSVRGTKKHGRSRNKFERFLSIDSEYTEESEESYANEKPRPRTVRDVKRNHQKQRSLGIRRRISSIYREVYGKHRGGSIPARISSKNIYGSTRRRKIYYREGDCDDIYSAGLSQSSDLDSLYCESACSKHSDETKCTRPFGALNQSTRLDFYSNVSNNDHVKDTNKIKSSKPLPPTPVDTFLANLFPPDETVRSQEVFLPPDLPPKTPQLPRMEETPISMTSPVTNV